jgi:polysaccharide deacetylase family protein (PEP-CTERM system associated)
MSDSRPSPLHALSFDIEDWFHIVEVECLENPANWRNFPTLVERYNDQILDTLGRSGTVGTFFVLGWIAERYPDLIRRIRDGGHEIGSHSFWHRRVDTMTRAEFRQDLMDSISAIGAASGVAAHCYRAPNFSIRPGCEWALDELLDNGVLWDASLFPARRGHGGYPCPHAPHRFSNLPSGRTIPELPLSQHRFLGRGFCFLGGGYFRLTPYGLVKRGVEAMERRGLPAVVSPHPRDFAPDCPRVDMPLLRRFKCYVGSETTSGSSSGSPPSSGSAEAGSAHRADSAHRDSGRPVTGRMYHSGKCAE